jgi:hypothetical protein
MYLWYEGLHIFKALADADLIWFLRYGFKEGTYHISDL